MASRRFSEASSASSLSGSLRKKISIPPFNVTGRRSPIADPEHVAGAHSYAPVELTGVHLERYFHPPFFATGRRSPLVARDAADSPGPASATISPLRRRAVSAPRRIASPKAAWHAPSIPFVSPPLTSPDPASYSPVLGRTRGGDAAVSFSRDKSQRTPVDRMANAPSDTPAPGAFSAAPMRLTGGAFIATVASSAFGPRSRPSTRSPDLDALARASTPGPGAYLGQYTESGFLRAAETRAASLPRATRDVFDGRLRDSHDGSRFASPAPFPAELRPQSSPSMLGGTEPRFRLPPTERQGRENPPPGTYNISRTFGAAVAAERSQPMRFPSAPRSSPLASSALRRGAMSGGMLNDYIDHIAVKESGGARSAALAYAEGCAEVELSRPIRGTTRARTAPAPPQLIIDAANASLVASASASLHGSRSPSPVATFNVAAQEGTLLGKTAGRHYSPHSTDTVPGPGAYDIAGPPRPTSLLWVGANRAQTGFGTGRRSPIVPQHVVPMYNARFLESITARIAAMPQ